MRTRLRFLAILAAVGWGSPAFALQPLEQFVRGARERDPANREAAAKRDAAAAQANEALARALPGVAANATFTRNQHEVEFGGLKVLPKNQRDTTITVRVPLVDLAKFVRISAASRAAEAATQGESATRLAREAEVAQTYYQLAANLGLLNAAKKSLEAVQLNHKMTGDAFKAGTATSLDVERASAEVERQSQQVTSARLAVALASRSLASHTGVTPDTSAGVALEDDLHAEPPLASFARAADATPAVRAALAEREAADRAATAQRLAILPTISAAGSQRFTNATGFLGGHDRAWAATISADWAFDFATVPGISARAAEARAARAREDAARLAVSDAIFRAWNTIDASLARSRSARVEAKVSAHAAEIARARYKSGVASQLELIQADRDAFAAEAAQIQSDADLLNARVQLRLATGVSTTGS